MSKLSPVQEFYKDKTIFITGASGYMGKVLIEKLLYSCSELKEIVVIVRPKRGKSPETRLDEMFRLPMFQRLRDEKPDMFKKVKMFQGDITYENFGLGTDNVKYLTDNVSIVFHLAATLKLEGNLKDAIQMNLTGTKRALDIAKQMKKLVSFVHVSTAFCNCDQEIVYEKVYEYPHKPEDLIRLVEWMDLKDIEKITTTLIKPHPNTYTYSKRLAEILVRDQYPIMPVVITRPSIVSPSASEPVPGWVDNLNGPTGLLIGAAKGVIRSMMVDGTQLSEVIPVDFAINGLITIAYETVTAKEKPQKIPVYNMTVPQHRKISWQKVLDIGREMLQIYPTEPGLWYPDGQITTNYWYHKINQILFMWLPAYFIDFLLLCFGQKRIMVRIQNKISVGLDVLQFFTMRAWNFRSETYEAMYRNLSESDKKNFDMDFSKYEDREYMKTGILGGRLYLLKEQPHTIPRSKTHLKLMYYLDRICKFIILGLFIYWLLCKFGIVDSTYKMFQRSPDNIIVS